MIPLGFRPCLQTVPTARATPRGRHSPRRGRPDATNMSQPTPLTTTWKRQRPAWKLHVHTWQWHLSGVSLPATDPRTPWHLRCKKIQAGHLTDRLPAANVSQSEYDTAVESRSCSDQNTACDQNTELTVNSHIVSGVTLHTTDPRTAWLHSSPTV